MNIRKVKSKLTALLAFLWFIGHSTIALGQFMPEITVRFANPQFDIETRVYRVDVELRAADSPQQLFGMNLRFFYDASIMEFRYLDEFHHGYGILGSAPQVYRGNSASGQQLFDLPEAAAYVNGAMQLLNDESPMELVGNQWTKAFRACFEVPSHLSNEEQFCPSLIWDIKSQVSKGGFLAGSDGLVVTVLENDPSTPEESAPAVAWPLPFNWEYGTGAEMPYGQPLAEQCSALGELVSSNHLATPGPTGHVLLQNHPNPFIHRTLIEFVLPEAQEARLSFFDVTGRLLNVIQGDYPAGYNALRLERAVWMEPSNVILYRLETRDYVSGMLKMIIANQ